jgi:hypothetical protein
MSDKVRELVMKHWYVGEGRAAKPSKDAILATLRANGHEDRATHLINTDASIGRMVMDASNQLRKAIKTGAASIKIVDVKGEAFEYAVEAPAAKPTEASTPAEAA